MAERSAPWRRGWPIAERYPPGYTRKERSQSMEMPEEVVDEVRKRL